uniref:Uncharacterized protein n=1 Tax=Anopheles farauti TaxID=69004 RepID=A0A182Q4L0_9DIPT
MHQDLLDLHKEKHNPDGVQQNSTQVGAQAPVTSSGTSRPTMLAQSEPDQQTPDERRYPGRVRHKTRHSGTQGVAKTRRQANRHPDLHYPPVPGVGFRLKSATGAAQHPDGEPRTSLLQVREALEVRKVRHRRSDMDQSWNGCEVHPYRIQLGRRPRHHGFAGVRVVVARLVVRFSVRRAKIRRSSVRTISTVDRRKLRPRRGFCCSIQSSTRAVGLFISGAFSAQTVTSSSELLTVGDVSEIDSMLMADRCLHRIERCALADERLDRRLVDAHEHVDALLLPDGGRDEGPAALEVGLLGLLQQCPRVLVRRFDHRAEPQVLHGVLVPAVHARTVRQGGELPDQRVVHLLRCALEEATAPGEEERIAGEHRARFVRAWSFNVVADVGCCMARRGQTAHPQLPDRERVILPDAIRQPTDPVVIATVHGQLAPVRILAVALAQRLIPAGMVPVVPCARATSSTRSGSTGSTTAAWRVALQTTRYMKLSFSAGIFVTVMLAIAVCCVVSGRRCKLKLETGHGTRLVNRTGDSTGHLDHLPVK